MHSHSFSGPFYYCSCQRSAEEEFRKELTHPGRPVSERLWDLRKKLFLLSR